MSADKYPERHKRDLLLSDRISQGTVKDIIKDIFEINFDDDEKEEIYKDWERKPMIKEETLRDYISRKAEWYIPATEAITLKLADKYYK